MDGTRFDRLTRAFARVGTRRQVVAGAAAVAVGGIEAADAATRCRAGRQTCQRDTQCCSGTCRRGKDVPLKDRNRCACGDGETQCGNACVDLAHDERNCGACGIRCRSGDLCCPDGCRDTKTDEENCGACGNICGSGEVCCGGTCADLATDADNCGACGNVCKYGAPCTTGICDYRAACLEVFDEHEGYCFFDAEGGVYPADFATYLEIGGWHASIPCTRSSECQEHPLCDLDTNTCICFTGDVWGQGPEDGGVYPGECYSTYRESVCSDPDVASGFPFCYGSVEGDGWGGYNQTRTQLSLACLSSDECQSLDARCDDPGYRCSCIYSIGFGGGNLFPMARTSCILDNTVPL